jgi:uncharacterized protein (TIGR02246 family)
MTRSAELALLALVVSCLLPARPATADEVREAVEAGNRAFIAAFLRGDHEAVASLYTEDAEVIPPGAETARGRHAIAAFWRGLIDSGIKDVGLETREVEAAGDLACELGTVKIVAADGTISVDRYVVVWKREGGRWKLHRDIWN